MTQTITKTECERICRAEYKKCNGCGIYFQIERKGQLKYCKKCYVQKTKERIQKATQTIHEKTSQRKQDEWKTRLGTTLVLYPRATREVWSDHTLVPSTEEVCLICKKPHYKNSHYYHNYTLLRPTKGISITDLPDYLKEYLRFTKRQKELKINQSSPEEFTKYLFGEEYLALKERT